jgi:ubiquinone/menaquinone biosynthesis C-methylase UbiE
MIKHARRRASVNHVRNHRFQVGAAESLAIPDQHYDVAVSSLFIHHLPAALQLTAVCEMSCVLRPGGTLLLADAKIPSTGRWHLLAALTGHLQMAEMVPPLRPLFVRCWIRRNPWWRCSVMAELRCGYQARQCRLLRVGE